ncbi:MAG TPA: hypothetical protein VIL72_05895 [Beijerinckiaceae bacterium]|jgi:hypothetical protein
MCGEDDDRAPPLQELCVDAFLAHGRRLAAEPAPAGDPVVGAIDALFRDALARAMRDCDGAPDGRRYDVMAMQPLAFARLAGFIAGGLPPGEDPLRRVIEALMHGYAEAERAAAAGGHDHGDGWHAH